MKFIVSSLIFFSLAMVPQGCREDDEMKEINLTEKAASLVKENNRFGLEMYRQIYAWEEDAQNMMVSPLSVALALAMTYNGAESATREAMEKTLRLYGFTREEINQSYHSLVEAMLSLDKKVILEIANAIYYRKGFSVEQPFVSTNQKFYGAEISDLDFSSPAAPDVINGWVNEKTHGKIPEIIREITPSHVMFLLNAIYFKGTWTREFDKKATVTLPFTTGDGRTVQAAMMARTDTLDYLHNDVFSAIRLSYGAGNFSMLVFLPGAGIDLDDLVEKLTPGNWSGWLEEFRKRETVDILLPKLKFAYEIKLNDVLTDMGMGIAFTPEADFTGINRDGGLNIDYVKHKTFVEVNEEGTEAAAVTIVAIDRTTAGPEKISFHVNRPFMFAITEKSTGAILFLGTVKNPLLEK